MHTLLTRTETTDSRTGKLLLVAALIYAGWVWYAIPPEVAQAASRAAVAAASASDQPTPPRHTGRRTDH
jgi:hypothetical protein